MNEHTGNITLGESMELLTPQERRFQRMVASNFSALLPRPTVLSARNSAAEVAESVNRYTPRGEAPLMPRSMPFQDVTLRIEPAPVSRFLFDSACEQLHHGVGSSVWRDYQPRTGGSGTAESGFLRSSIYPFHDGPPQWYFTALPHRPAAPTGVVGASSDAIMPHFRTATGDVPFVDSGFQPIARFDGDPHRASLNDGSHRSTPKQRALVPWTMAASQFADVLVTGHDDATNNAAPADGSAVSSASRVQPPSAAQRAASASTWVGGAENGVRAECWSDVPSVASCSRSPRELLDIESLIEGRWRQPRRDLKPNAAVVQYSPFMRRSRMRKELSEL